LGNLAPGRYTIAASLNGFQTKTITDAQLSQGASSRYNFELNVASGNTQGEVTVSADTILSSQGATIGQSLDEQKVHDLPIVGNNVLDLITVMAGVEYVVPTNPPSAANAFGRENTTFAGVRADNVMIVRDGIDMNDNRSPNGIYSITTINPDLVGEVRMILAPVDVELGRGNGSIQYTTRSGTNKFTGSAVWTFRNTALDPNTWSNNRSQTIPTTASAETRALAAQGRADLALEPNWTNTQQGTVSFGGPIIRNKTFFFGLVDYYSSHLRSLDNFIVLTPCARRGIVRYFNTWNPTNAIGIENTAGANPTLRSVDLAGNPIPPAAPSSGSATGFNNAVQYRSIFGPLAATPTTNDCSDAAINPATLVPNGVSVTGALGTNSGGWDPFRRQLDLSGYTARELAGIPLPNNYEIGDGLNTAGYRVLRRSRGLDNLFGSGEATGVRKQFNVKIDHNFNSNNKANVKGPADLKGLRVGVARASTQDIALTAVAPPGTEIRRFDDDASGMQALMSGQVDALGCSTTVAAQIEKRAPPNTYAEKFVLKQQVMGIAMRPGQPALEKAVNDFIDKNKANGELDKLYQKWLGTKLPAMQAT
jgi:hypothetical protein